MDGTYVINQSQLYFVRLAVPLDTIEEIRVNPMLATAQSGQRISRLRTATLQRKMSLYFATFIRLVFRARLLPLSYRCEVPEIAGGEACRRWSIR